LVQLGSPKWSHDELGCEQSPPPIAHRASLGARTEHFGSTNFLWKSVRFSSLPVSPWWWHVLFSPHKLNQLSIPLPHQKKGEMFSLFSHQFCPGRVQHSHQLHWPILFPPEQMMCYIHLEGLWLHLVEPGQLQES
jgi:hypothetical protein